jgi:hypothetical protein
MKVTSWPGTSADLLRLLDVIKRNCICDASVRLICESHRMLLDQRTMDHLAYIVARRESYQDEEQRWGDD